MQCIAMDIDLPLHKIFHTSTIQTILSGVDIVHVVIRERLVLAQHYLRNTRWTRCAHAAHVYPLPGTLRTYPIAVYQQYTIQ